MRIQDSRLLQLRFAIAGVAGATAGLPQAAERVGGHVSGGPEEGRVTMAVSRSMDEWACVIYQPAPIKRVPIW